MNAGANGGAPVYVAPVDELRAVIAAALCGGGEEQTLIHVTHERVAEQITAALLARPATLGRVVASFGELVAGHTTVAPGVWTPLIGAGVLVRHDQPGSVPLSYRPPAPLAPTPEG